jgi:putative exporter of polyketide antibiotics
VGAVRLTAGCAGWSLAVSPFHDVGRVPGAPFKAGAATIMLGLAALLCVAALWAIRRRDLIGA